MDHHLTTRTQLFCLEAASIVKKIIQKTPVQGTVVCAQDLPLQANQRLQKHLLLIDRGIWQFSLPNHDILFALKEYAKLKGYD